MVEFKSLLQGPKETPHIQITPTVFKDEDTYYAVDWSKGILIDKGTDALTVFQTIESDVPANSKVVIRHGDYIFSAKWSPAKKLRLHGEGLGTRLLPDGAFDAIDPANLAMIDIVWRDKDGVDHDASFDPNMFSEVLEEEIKELQKLNQQFPILARLAIDPAGRLRVIIDAAGTATPISTVTTVTTVTTLSAITSFIYGQSWELIQRANIEYEECQRRKMTFT